MNLKARVIRVMGFFPPEILTEGDIVTLTRDDREYDGSVATDLPGTWGFIGIHYELLEEEK